VPSRWVGLDLVVRIGATSVTIIGHEGTLIQHPRKRFGQRAIDYRHYLSELARKPQAVRQVLPDLLRDLGDPARLFAKVLGQLDVRRSGAAADRSARCPGAHAPAATAAPRRRADRRRARLCAFDRVGGELLFNLMTDRYERRATVVTTNLAFAEWVTVFAGDEKLTTALLESLSASRHRAHNQGQELSHEEATRP
jgi:hypothetical protein